MSGIMEPVQGDQVENARAPNAFHLTSKTDTLTGPYVHTQNINQDSYPIRPSASDGLLNHNGTSYLPIHGVPFYMGGSTASNPSDWSNADPHVPFAHGYSGEGQQATNFIQDVYRPSANGHFGGYFGGAGEFTLWNSQPMVADTPNHPLGHQSTASNGTYNGFFQPVCNGAPPMNDFMRPSEPLPTKPLPQNAGFLSDPTAFNGSSVLPKNDFTKIPDSGTYGVSDVNYVEERMGGLNLSEHLPFNARVSGQTRGVYASNIPKQAPGNAAVGSLVTKADTIQSNNLVSAPVNPAPAPPKKHTWAAIASRPAKAPQQPAKQKPKTATSLGSSTKSKDGAPVAPFGPNSSIAPKPAAQPRWISNKPPSSLASNAAQTAGARPAQKEQLSSATAASAAATQSSSQAGSETLEMLKSQNDYNPKRLTIDGRNAKFFVIKSYSEDDIHRSIKYNIWCSTEHGNKRLDAAFRDQNGKGPVILLFSVNGSGHFCGVAEMLTEIDYSKRASFWSQDKWKGKFQVKWIYAKDVPNNVLRHIRLENNENKPVTNSRDAQEVPVEKGCQVLKIISQYKHTTSIFDDFAHYERRQEEEENLKKKKNGYEATGKGASH